MHFPAAYTTTSGAVDPLLRDGSVDLGRRVNLAMWAWLYTGDGDAGPDGLTRSAAWIVQRTNYL